MDLAPRETQAAAEQKTGERVAKALVGRGIWLVRAEAGGSTGLPNFAADVVWFSLLYRIYDFYRVSSVGFTAGWSSAR